MPRKPRFYVPGVPVHGAVVILARANKGDGVGVVVIALFVEYTGTQLTAIRDAGARRVEYRYDLDGNLTTFLDVLGNPWTYTYARNVYSDIKCEVRYEHRNGVLVEVFRSCVPVTIVEDKYRLVSRTDPEGRTLTRGFTANGFVGGLTYPDGTQTQYTFDYDSSRREHYLREQTPAGTITESWLDEDGDVIRKDVNGRTVSTLVKDTVLRTRTETDARGLKTIRAYDQFDNVTQITYPDLSSVSTTYDPIYAQPLQKTDERGTITKYEYDAKGNFIRLTEAVGKPEQRVTEYIYDAHGQRLTETKRGGTVTLPDGTAVSIADATTTSEYDTQGNVTAVIDAENNRTEYTYDVMGNALTKLDARGKLWTRTFDLAGRLTGETDPLNHTTAYAYDKTGLRIKTTDAVLNETLYGYDLRGNLTTITDPYGGITRYEYNADNQLVKQVDQEGKVRSYEYDPDGRLVNIIDGLGNTVSRIYGDAASGLEGLVVKTDYPTFSQEFKYDSRSRLTQVIDVLDSSTRHTVTITHDAAGNRSSITDQEGKTTQYNRDALRRPVRITDPADGVTEITYDNHDNLIALKDQKNQIYRFAYDRNNRKTQEIRPMGQTIVYKYDAAGNLENQTDPKGQVRKFIYDDDERLTQEDRYLSASDTTPVKSITFSYNELGARIGYSDGITQGTTNYDTRQLRKLGETINYGAFSKSYSYAYYGNGAKKSFTYPDGTVVNYTYDSENQLSTLGLPVGNVTVNARQWYAPTQITYPGGTTRTQAYDPLMQLKGIQIKDPAQNEVLNYQYSYDKAGNITTKTTEHGSYSYSYDNLYRVKTVANPSPLVNESYTFDAVGNRLTDSQVAGSWGYNANNELGSFGDASLEYDLNGNTAQKTSGNNVTQYIYDTADRLIEVRETDTTTNATTTIATYVYDPYGRRLWKEVNNQKTYFLYSDEGLIGEYDATGTQTKAYGYQPDGAWGTIPVYLKTNNQYYFYQNDYLGTSQKLIAQDGTKVWSAKAQAFGTAVVDAGSTVVNNLRFPGQYFDQETELHYNWNRSYDPRLGRYITSDPIGLKGGINTYAYVGSNPLRLTDPTGLAISICYRALHGGVPGNHSYLWDDTKQKCCGRVPGTDPLVDCKEKGPPGDYCVKVAGSDGRENEMLQCCNKRAQKGRYTPGFNDCFNTVEDCVSGSGLTVPPGPRGGPRTGLCPSCYSNEDPPMDGMP